MKHFCLVFILFASFGCKPKTLNPVEAPHRVGSGLLSGAVSSFTSSLFKLTGTGLNAVPAQASALVVPLNQISVALTNDSSTGNSYWEIKYTLPQLANFSQVTTPDGTFTFLDPSVDALLPIPAQPSPTIQVVFCDVLTPNGYHCGSPISVSSTMPSLGTGTQAVANNSLILQMLQKVSTVSTDLLDLCRQAFSFADAANTCSASGGKTTLTPDLINKIQAIISNPPSSYLAAVSKYMISGTTVPPSTSSSSATSAATTTTTSTGLSVGGKVGVALGITAAGAVLGGLAGYAIGKSNANNNQQNADENAPGPSSENIGIDAGVGAGVGVIGGALVGGLSAAFAPGLTLIDSVSCTEANTLLPKVTAAYTLFQTDLSGQIALLCSNKVISQCASSP
jgi:hypothetical protein